MKTKGILKRAIFAAKYGETLVLKKDYILGRPAEGLMRGEPMACDAKHSPLPWVITFTDPRHYAIRPSGPTRVVSEWRIQNPTLSQNSFGFLEVCSGGDSINGSGDHLGPPRLIDDEEIRANGELIVKAVNCHDSLVNTLELIMTELDILAGLTLESSDNATLSRLSGMALEAIAKAEGAK